MLFKVYGHILWYSTLYCPLLSKSFYRLHTFCCNCLTTFLPTNNIYKKHLICMSLILHCSYFLNLANVFHSITYYLKTLLEDFYGLYTFCQSFLATFLLINDINKKHSIYIPLIFCHNCYLKFAGIFYDIVNCLRALFESF